MSGKALSGAWEWLTENEKAHYEKLWQKHLIVDDLWRRSSPGSRHTLSQELMYLAFDMMELDRRGFQRKEANNEQSALGESATT